MGALQYVDVPTYSAGLFRLTEEDLYKPKAIGDRCREWFTGTAAKWDGDSKSWRFPSYDSNPGAMIHLGFGASQPLLEKRYQGPEFQYIGIEELGQWTEPAYTWFWSRLRRLLAVAHVKTRMRSTFNPGGVGAEWIRDRFIEHARHVETGMGVRQYNAMRKRREELPSPPYFKSPPSKEAEEIAKQYGTRAQGAYFVPAFAEDNPGLDVADYRMKLSRLDPVRRAQLDEGDWWAIQAGEFFKQEWFRFVEQAPVTFRQKVRYWDLAATAPKPGTDPDWTAGVLMSIERTADDAYKIYIEDVDTGREDSGGTEARVKSAALRDGKDVKVWIEEEPGSAGKNNTHNYSARVLQGFDVEGHRKTGSKESFWGPLSSAARSGLLYLVRAPWNAHFIRELCALPNGKKDQADAASGAFSKLIDAPASYGGLPEESFERRF